VEKHYRIGTTDLHIPDYLMPQLHHLGFLGKSTRDFFLTFGIISVANSSYNEYTNSNLNIYLIDIPTKSAI